jgi:hypothetical protein
MNHQDKKLLYLFKNTKRIIYEINNHPDDSKHTYIIKSDKGNVITLIPKEMYESQLNNMLNDKNVFRSSRTNPTNKIQTTLDTILNKLVNKKQMTEYEKQKLTIKYPIPPKIYGQPKIHKIKDNSSLIPFRIITCFC